METDNQGYFNFLDEQSTGLVIQIQLDDINAQAASSKGKSPEGQQSDAELAFQLYRQDLEEYNSFLFDRRMTRSIASAVKVDADVLANTAIEEASIARDRDIAQSIHAGSNVSNVDTRNDTPEQIFPDDELLEKLAALYVYGVGDGQEVLFDIPAVGDGSDVVPESSTWAASRPTRSTSMNRRCAACGEDKPFFDVARVPCRHEYCRQCLGELYQASLTDESLFPPRCCRQPIPVATVQVFLNSQLVSNYQRKKIEFETPNRTYCHAKACSAFIRTENITGEIATCAECELRTCTSCKLLAHDGDCLDDVGLQQVLQLATEHGWQRCYSCWRLVELDHGCNHMTCPCSAEFCYICGVQWKTCTCDQWDEHRLLQRAVQIIDREQEPVGVAQIMPAEDEPLDEPPVHQPVANDRAPIRPLPEEPMRDEPQSTAQAIAVVARIPAEGQTPRDLLIRQTMRDLMENHECDHTYWRWVNGAHQCEECYHFLPQYIFECRQCRLQACNRCRRHRL